MRNQKYILMSILLFSNIIFAQEISWFSPSYYSNLISNGYEKIIEDLKNSWPAKQLQSIQQNFFTNLATKELHKKYLEKEASNRVITNAILSADKFKQAIINAANANPNGIMARFKNNPKKFLFGASSSSYQCEGGLDEHNASARFYTKHHLPTAGKAIDFWNRYKTDIPQMKRELGINSFRLSIAWDRVEPTQGNYSQSAIDRYVDIIETLKAHKIEPIVVLHHYTIPTWFEDMDGFKNSDNITHFVNFALKMYENLYQHVTYWSTFNAIEGYAFKGYFRGDGAPGNPQDKGNMELVAQVMLNMLNAHVEIYKNIKEKYRSSYSYNTTIPNPQVGIQKNIVLLDPSYKYLSHFCLSGISKICTTFGKILQNEGFYKFFTTGTYAVWVPTKVNASYYNPDAQGSLDWIGLNIYSNMFLFLSQPQPETRKERQTANLTYRDYPEGIYRATKEIYNRIAQPLNIPIIITENGIATDDDAQRTRFFQRTLYTIRKLIEENYPIIGYIPWASHDNYEWPSTEQPEAFTSRRYGFFRVNFDKQSPHYLERTLKNGAHYYRDFINKYFGQSQQQYIKPQITQKRKP